MPRPPRIRLITKLILQDITSLRPSSFIADGYIFYDKKKCVLKDLMLGNVGKACTIQITWRIQKNHQNGQAITLATDVEHPEICPVCSALRIVMRAQHLGQPSNFSIGVYKSRKGKTLYLMGNKIAKLLCTAVCTIQPDMSTEELKCYSAHSLRVWACVLLDEAGKSPEYIKIQLRWLGDLFCMYQRDALVIQHQHVDALQHLRRLFL